MVDDLEVRRKRRESLRTTRGLKRGYSQDQSKENETNNSKESKLIQNNEEIKNGTNSYAPSSSCHIHLRFDGTRTSVLCKAGSFIIKRPKIKTDSDEPSVTSSTTSYSASLPPDDCQLSTVSYDNDEEGVEYEPTTTTSKVLNSNEITNSSTISKHNEDLLVQSVNKKNISRKISPSKDKKQDTIRHSARLVKQSHTEIISCPNHVISQEKNKFSQPNDVKDLPNNKHTRDKRKRSCSLYVVEKETKADECISSPENPPNFQSWADKTAENQGAQCNAIQVTMIGLLRKIRRQCDQRGFFALPVDPERDECLDYFDIIDKENEAMDLKTMEDLIRNGTLRDMKDFVFYLDRIVKCALKYNSDPENLVHQQAEEFHQKAIPLVELTKIRLDKMNNRRKSSYFPIIESKETKRTEDAKDLRKTEDNVSRRKNGLKRKCTNGNNLEEPDDTSFSNASSNECDYSSNKHQQHHHHHQQQQQQQQQEKKNMRGPWQTEISYEKRQMRKRKHTSFYVDNCSEESDTSVATPIHPADIPYCQKGLLDSKLQSDLSREEWISLCPNLVMVCNEAARRAALQSNPNANRFDKPLSATYIKERLEFGNPLRGNAVWVNQKCKGSAEGLQGFIISTNFITWKKSLRFSMETPAAGLTLADKRIHAWDDGSITQYLQETERSGEISEYGIVFDRVAEIALLGGLGCGSFLLRKTLRDLERSGEYDGVVLQATKNAIPFYQRHGFVRIGAVARFNDEDHMPEIAYRHWSEIKDGEVVEASYMMALQLHSSTSDTWQKEIPNDLSHEEIESSLLSAKKLLMEALSLKMSLSNGGRPTFYELIVTAREFAYAAKDNNLVGIIDRATKQSVGYTIQHSKSILRSGLNFPTELSLTTHTCNKTESKSISVKLKIYGEEILSEAGGEFLDALVPIKVLHNKSVADTMHRDVVVHVVCDGKYVSEDVFGSGEILPNLRAIVAMPERSNFLKVKEAASLSFHNLQKTAHVWAKGKNTETWGELLFPNNQIMLQVGASNEPPLWLAGSFERRCKRPEVPKGTYFKHACIVTLSHGETVTECLDRSGTDLQRGVGRKWCTFKDWGGFPVLPIFVLDMILVGSKVKYTDLNDCDIEGIITNRVGGGLQNEPKWRIKTRHNKRDNLLQSSFEYEDLEAATLRDIIIVDEDNVERVMNMIYSMGPVPASPQPIFSSFFWKDCTEFVNELCNHVKENIEENANNINACENKPNIPKNDDGIDEWVVQRMQYHMLGDYCNQRQNAKDTTMERNTPPSGSITNTLYRTKIKYGSDQQNQVGTMKTRSKRCRNLPP